MHIDYKAIIVNTFLELCETMNFDNITVAEIIRRSGLARQTFYNHFKDKRDLIEWIYKMDFYNAIELYEDVNMTYLDVTKQGYYSFLKRKTFFKKVIHSDSRDSFISFLYSLTRQEFHNYLLKHQKLDVIDDDLSYTIDFAVGGGVYLLLKWIEDGMVLSPEEITHYYEVSFPQRLKEYYFGNDNEC